MTFFDKNFIDLSHVDYTYRFIIRYDIDSVIRSKNQVRVRISFCLD